MTGCGLTALSG